MLSTLRVLPRRFARVQAAALHTSVPLRADKDKAEEDISPAGIDRTNPLYAPSYRREWKHQGYDNIANRDNPAEWKEWEDLPAPYKYYHVKVDPADVENEGMIWKLATNWKTAIPLALSIAVPAFVFDVIVVDSHMELAAIFWACVAMVYRNAGDAIRGSLAEENEEVKKTLYGAEGEYFAALQENIDVHKKAIGLPGYVKAINVGERALKAVEAAAATRRVRATEAARMAEMLEYLAATSGVEEGAAASTAIVDAQLAVDAKLAEGGAEQQATIADAIAALKAGGQLALGNTTEKLFNAAYTTYVNNPPKPDPAAAAAQKERESEIFNKRFGFVERALSEGELAKAQGDAAAMALLQARTGGNVSAGAALKDPNPMDFLRA
jgi:hypothetical protein